MWQVISSLDVKKTNFTFISDFSEKYESNPEKYFEEKLFSALLDKLIGLRIKIIKLLSLYFILDKKYSILY